MKIPRDISASDLVRALRVLGYETVRQDGSHMRLTTTTEGTTTSPRLPLRPLPLRVSPHAILTPIVPAPRPFATFAALR